MFGEPRAQLSSADIGDFDAVITLWQQFTPATFAGVERLAPIARWGVGYDMVDVGACTENDEVLDRPAFKAKLEQLRERWKTISIT
jgi:phosphoglycerate dehydrogenase-like enzyme